jgi:hypothetical protein
MHQNRISDKDGRWLVVVDLFGDLNEDAWNMLHSYCKQCMTRSCKIIITSRSDNITKYGTTRALNLKYMSREGFWYFFKTIIFGSMDPEMHPRFTHKAMEIAKTLTGCLIGANGHGSFAEGQF